MIDECKYRVGEYVIKALSIRRCAIVNETRVIFFQIFILLSEF